jgi:hypothetical protein
VVVVKKCLAMEAHKRDGEETVSPEKWKIHKAPLSGKN